MNRWAVPIVIVMGLALAAMMRGDTDSGPSEPVSMAWPVPTPAQVIPLSTATPAPTPTAAPISAPAATATSDVSHGTSHHTLTYADFISVALTVGYPRELAEEAYRVACGGGSTVWGESGCQPGARNGVHYGLMQISGWWADYCGVDEWTLTSPSVNLACALVILRYEEEVGVERWHNWQIKP